VFVPEPEGPAETSLAEDAKGFARAYVACLVAVVAFIA